VIALRRARLALAAALVLAAAIIGFEFPFAELVHQRGELASLDASVAHVVGADAALRADIAALSSSATLAAIAHEQYGLVRPGQQPYVVLPPTRAAGPPSGLETPEIPPADLIAAPPGTTGATGSPSAPSEPGFWARVVDRLEFWRSL